MFEQARLVDWSPTRIDGQPGFRLMVVLAAPGCAWYKASGGCSNCSFPQSMGTGVAVSADEYVAQFEAATDRIPTSTGSDAPIAVDLFVSGSFFNASEVDVESQRRLLQRAARKPRVRRILVESRPEYISADALHRARQAAGEIPLEIAIGLESASDEIRTKRIRKGFTWRQFEQAARLVAAAGMSLFVYVLLKPLHTTEAEALADSQDTAKKVFALGEALKLPVRVGLEPCFVAPDTKLDQEYQAGHYHPPWLWSLVEVTRRIASLGPVHVGLSDEDLQPAREAHNCDLCSGRVRKALGQFNMSQDAGPLAELDCECKAEWKQALKITKET